MSPQQKTREFNQVVIIDDLDYELLFLEAEQEVLEDIERLNLKGGMNAQNQHRAESPAAGA